MTIVGLHGLEVDVSGDKWLLDEVTTLHLTPILEVDPLAELRLAQRMYLSSMIPTHKPITIKGRMRGIDALLKQPDIVTLLEDDDVDMAEEMFRRWNASTCTSTTISRLKIVRDWFRWCADKGLRPFDPDQANTMLEKVYGNPGVGEAVLRLDPTEGPLTEAEIGSLNRALWAELDLILSGADGRRPSLRTVVACLLMSILGPNPENLRQLDESDLRPSQAGRPDVLMMPRAKRRGLVWREAFVERELSPRLARAVQALIEENRRYVPLGDAGEIEERPLFRRRFEQGRLDGTPFAHASERVGGQFFAHALLRAVDAFSLVDRQGAPLALTPRRLRYTVARRLVARGMRPELLMKVLDHNSLKNLMIYYSCGLEIVPHLDAAMGPLAKALANLIKGRLPPALAARQPALAALYKDRTGQRQATAPEQCLRCPMFQPRSAQALRTFADRLQARCPTTSSDVATLARRARISADLCEAVV